jgi:hypothetical protein
LKKKYISVSDTCDEGSVIGGDFDVENKYVFKKELKTNFPRVARHETVRP